MKIKLTQEMVNHVQRLGMEVDSRAFIIDRMFANHKDDTDSKMFESVPFKKYSEELGKLKAEYDLTVERLGEEVIKPLVIRQTKNENVKFDWKIDNFADLEAEITLLEE